MKAKDIDFGHDQIEVRSGETVRFMVTNTGQMPHEFTIGPPSVQKAHRREMQEMMQSAGGSDGHGHSDGHGDGHDDGHGRADASGHGHGNSVLVQPGETRALIWHFEKVRNIHFGCNVPGHYEAGMHGQFVTAG